MSVKEKNASVKKNFLYNTLLQIAILIIPFLTTPYVSRRLGAENVGQFSFATAMVTYFTLIANLGSNTHGQRKTAYCRDNREHLSQAFWDIVSFRCIMSIVAIGLYLLYLYLFQDFSFINIIVIYHIIDIAIGITWFYQGIEDFKKITLRTLGIRLLLLCGIFIFVKNDQDLWRYALIMMLSTVLGNLVMWVPLRKYITTVKRVHPFRDFKEIWLVFLPTIAVQVYTILDKSMIGFITGSDYANGCYEYSERIARLAITVVTSVGTVILPRVANLFAKDNLDEAKRYVYLAFRVVWMVAIPIMLGLMAVSSVFVPWFLGTGYEDSILLLCIFSVLVLVVSMAYIVGLSYLVPTKQQNVYTAAVTVAAIVNFCANMILIPKFGAFGAAIASVLAECIGTSIQIVYCIGKKQLSATQIFKPAWKYIVSGVMMYLCLFLLKRVFSSGFISLVVLVSSGMVIYAILLIILQDSFFIDNTKKIILRFSKKHA